MSLLLPFFVLTGVLTLGGFAQPTEAATSDNLNFQGRLLTNTGGLVPDGTYNIEFNLYTVDTGGTSEWTETRLNSAGQGVTVRNGYYSVYLGDVTPFPNTINWDQELWLGMTVRGDDNCAFAACTPTDAEMTPRFELTSVPYAFRAGAIVDAAGNSYTGDDFVQIAPSTFQAINAAESAIRLNQAGSGGLLELQGDGITVFNVDKTGATTLGAGLTLGDSTSTIAGTVRWTGADFEGFDGTSWVSLTSGGGLGAGVSSATATFYDSTGGATVTSGARANINLNATLANSDASIISLTGSEVTVTESGYYEISYQVTSRLASGTRSGFNAVLQRNNGAGFVDVPGAGAFHYGRITSETQGTSSATVTIQLDAGDILRLQGQGTTQSFTTIANATNMTVTRLGDDGGGAGSTSFQQNGNAFGVNGVLGTTDANGLDIITDGNIAVNIDAAGAVTLNNGLSLTSGNIDVGAGDITNVGNIDASGALVISSGGAGDLTLDAASDVLVLADSTLRRNGAGITTFDLQDAGASTGLSILNSDATQVANLQVEGTVTASGFSGNGSGLTDLNGTAITSGTIADARLTTNVALLNADQTFTGAVAFDENTLFNNGFTVGNSALNTAGNIRFNGTDFEGFDGTSWVSLTSGGGGGGPGANVIKTVDETISTAVTLQDDDELLFPVGANQTWTFDFVVQASTGATPDIQFAITAPAGSTCLYGYEDAEGSASGSQFGCGVTTGRIEGTGANDTYRITGTVTTDVTAGDVQLQWSQATSNAANTVVRAGSFVSASEQNGGSGGIGSGGGSGLSFVQNGNDFGATAILGTTDAFGLNIVTNGSNALSFTSAGLGTFANDLTIDGGLSINGNVQAINGLELASGTFSDLTLTSASGDIIVNADTLRRNASGTTTLDLLDAGADTTFSILNTDLGNVANLSVEGSIAGADIVSSGNVSAVSFSGNGSGLIGLDGANISTGIIPDARLSSNISRLDTASTFTALQTFSSGVVLGNSVSSDAGAIRFTGTDFEGFDGTQWISLTTPQSAPLLEGVIAFGKYDGAAGTALDIDGASVVKNGTGDYTVTFDTAPTNAAYTVLLTVDEPVATLDDIIAQVNGQTTSEFSVAIHEGDNGGTAGVRRDRTWNFVVIDADAVAGGTGGGLAGLEFVNGGNAFGGTAQLGTTDANGLRLFTDNNIVLDIDALGASNFTGTLSADGLITASNGLTVATGSLNLSSNGITNTGAIAGATTINASGVATVGGLTTTGTVNATTALIDSLTTTNAIIAPTTGETINGLVINAGALDSVSGFNQTSGNFTLNGTGTFTTGTGDVTFNGDVTAATTLGVNDGLTINGADIDSTSRLFVQDAITVGTGILTGPGVTNTYTFDADNDADEAAWTFVSDNGTNGLNVANTSRAWSHDTNDTTSTDVGPTSGEGGDPDGYIYTEGSAGTAFNDTFHITYNTVLDAAASNWVVEFFWNQRGNDNTALLDLQTNENGAGWVTQASFGGGDQGTGASQVWNFESIDLSAVVSDASTQVRFLVTMPAAGTIWHNDFALDTITIREDTATSGFVYSDNLIEGYNASATSDVDLLSLRSDVGETENVVFRVDSDGDVFSDGVNNIAGGADIAENYLNTDGAEPGDVVYFTDNRTVAKTTEESQAGLAGVVSTDAAVILDASVDGVPVGLKGRLPTKVSIANGTIRRGDYLTSGPDGRAVKAIHSGTAIGIAMEHIETDGVIDVFVGLTYYVAQTGDALPSAGLTFMDGSQDQAPSEDLLLGASCESDGCGYLALATGLAIEDDTLADTIYINKTGEKGNLIRLERGGQAVFTVANTGSLEIRSNSSSALDIKNIGGTSYLAVDTQTGITTAANIDVTGSFTGAGLTNCDGEYDALQWNAASGLFSCRSIEPRIAQINASTDVLGISTEETLSFDEEVRASEGYSIETVDEATVLIVEDSGWYETEYSISSVSTGDDAALECSVRINGADIAQQSTSYGYRAIGSDVILNARQSLIELEAGDYLEVVCAQSDSDTSSDTIAADSWFAVEKR